MTKPAYRGPRSLADAFSAFRLQRGDEARFEREGLVTLRAGDALSQPAGVPHNVIARSDDFEVLELNVPADYGTFDL